jgi:hypothetical protein
MKQILFILMASLVLPVAAAAQAQPESPGPAKQGVGDWSRVQNLARGDALEIKKTDGHSAYCLFAGATRDILFCDENNPFRAGEYSIERADVERIRMAPTKKRVNKIVGVSAALGFVAGVALPESNGTPRFVGGLAGGALGMLVGCAVAVPAIFVPGKLVYRQQGIARPVTPVPTQAQ